MKAYMFSLENGLYEGETFIEPDKLECESGITTVTPPAHQTGLVPVFDTGRRQWALVPVSSFRERYLGTKGKDNENFEPCSN